MEAWTENSSCWCSMTCQYFQARTEIESSFQLSAFMKWHNIFKLHGKDMNSVEWKFWKTHFFPRHANHVFWICSTEDTYTGNCKRSSTILALHRWDFHRSWNTSQIFQDYIPNFCEEWHVKHNSHGAFREEYMQVPSVWICILAQCHIKKIVHIMEVARTIPTVRKLPISQCDVPLHARYTLYSDAVHWNKEDQVIIQDINSKFLIVRKVLPFSFCKVSTFKMHLRVWTSCLLNLITELGISVEITRTCTNSMEYSIPLPVLISSIAVDLQKVW